jgi:hypothetical protein
LGQHILSIVIGFGTPGPPPQMQIFPMACGTAEVLDS